MTEKGRLCPVGDLGRTAGQACTADLQTPRARYRTLCRRWGHASWHPGSATTRRSRAAHFGLSTAAAEAHSLRAGCR